MIEAFVILIVACAIFGVCAALEQATRPKVRPDDQPSPSESGLW